ncbi:LysM peptidoglycan-binding domain-containing protein [Serpentinicella sp. ANB-PHB4]|uniref:LysM peptidoglycan-binding domain-containing protein n=1 Tax=Serpentinicella sp. ANB-PHB4 TaxID=3074076 RepID=UPI0028553EE2|nr:LysM peptidoglycan-binding domain-containing protein [Serpentinicella sp. ANB-PHB4]MDR5659359.1 LysM peptidoglycan-binding domain-containing protein [Serpentinicella sp. ANB-PHB4]
MNSKVKKIVIGTTIASSMFIFSISGVYANQIKHVVEPGDTLWGLSQKYEISLDKIFSVNSSYANGNILYVGDIVSIPSRNIIHKVKSGDSLWRISDHYEVSLQALLLANDIKSQDPIYPGNQLIIPDKEKQIAENTYTVQDGDNPWSISKKFNVAFKRLLSVNELGSSDYIYPGQSLIIPKDVSKVGEQNNKTAPLTPQKTYTNHRVVSGDNMWSISIQHGIPFHELLEVNGFTENHVIHIGDEIKIPVYYIPEKPTLGHEYGELLDWWTEAQYVVPINKKIKIIDFYTGKEWYAKRTIGANHADTEPLTANDAAIMKTVWGGNYSWQTRPVIVKVDGRRLAASASSMPHDIEFIKNNNFKGHFDLYFSNSTRHVDGQPDSAHERNVLIAAGHNS